MQPQGKLSWHKSNCVVCILFLSCQGGNQGQKKKKKVEIVKIKAGGLEQSFSLKVTVGLESLVWLVLDSNSQPSSIRVDTTTRTMTVALQSVVWSKMINFSVLLTKTKEKKEEMYQIKVIYSNIFKYSLNKLQLFYNIVTKRQLDSEKKVIFFM